MPIDHHQTGISRRRFLGTAASVGGLAGGVLGTNLLGMQAAGATGASEFYAALSPVPGSKRPPAHLEFSVDTLYLPTAHQAEVYSASGTRLTGFAVAPNERGFATTATAEAPYDNTCAITDGLPAMVRVRRAASGPGPDSVAVHQFDHNKTILRHDIPLTVGGDGTYRSAGRLFEVAAGDATGSAPLVANASGSDVFIDVFRGTKGPDGGGEYSSVLAFPAMWRVDLQAIDAESNIVIHANNAVIVQVAVARGGHFSMATLQPRSR